MERTLVLKGLNCAHCAGRIEAEVGKQKGISEATVNLATQKLIFEIKENENAEEIKKFAIDIVNRIEDGITIVEETEISNRHEHGHAQEHDHDHEHGHEHAHDHSHSESEFGRDDRVKFIVGAAIFAFGLLFRFETNIEFVIFFVAYLLVGGDVLLRSGKNILKGQVFDENFLMSIATIGAFAIGEFPEGVAVMLFYQIGEFFQDMAVSNSRKSISELMDIRPDFANLKTNGGVKKVSPEDVAIGDIIIVKAGEKIPLDGVVTDGYGAVDTSALTGESLPRDVEPGDPVLSGTINKNGLLTIEVTKEFGDSTVSKILDLVENASNKKSPTEHFITKFAKYYTPAVVYLALAVAFLPPLFIQGASFLEWVNRALVFLVISCPCALVVSIPLGFFGGIGGASKKGILIKGSNYLEALNHIETVVFDKTGTLTKGVFKVTGIKEYNGFSKDQILQYAAYAEAYSNHPIGLSIKKAFGSKVEEDNIVDYEEIAGQGIRVRMNGKEIIAGNKKLMPLEGIQYGEIAEIGTKVYIAIENVLAGCIIISDEIKEDSKAAIRKLKELGVKTTVMLTGDSKAVGQRIAKDLNIDQVYCELLPDQKVAELEKLNHAKTGKGKLVFVGDGINDAPVLAMADIGVSMGALGSDAAIEAADVVLMTDEPSKLVEAIQIARRTKNIVWQNIFFALGVKLIVLILGAGGIATMWEAVFADVGVSLIAILNAMRVMRGK